MHSNIWARPGVWALAKSSVSKTRCGACRKVKGAALDFHNMPPIPEGKLALAKRASDITLKGAQTTAATLLPEDAQYQVASEALQSLPVDSGPLLRV